MDPRARKKTLRMLSNGMYVITSRSGDHYGAATVTWVSRASFKFQCLRDSRVAAIHILGCDQQDMAQRFFSPTWTEPGAINGEPFTEGKTSAPILLDAPAYLECRVHQIIDGGDHAIVIMEAVEAECRQPVRPLTIRESPWEYGG